MALTDNLVSYWKLDESSGNAADSVGSNTLTNNGTGTYSSAKINNGYNIAAGKYLSLAADVFGGTYTNISISFWVNLSSTSLGGGFFRVGDFGGATGFGIGVGGSQYDGSSNGNNLIILLDDISWIVCGSFGGSGVKHVVVTRGASEWKAYVNGTQLSFTETRSPRSANAKTFLGADQGQYTGYIDEIGVWSRELSQSEASQLYYGFTGNQYPFAVVTSFNQAGGISTSTGTAATQSITAATATGTVLFVAVRSNSTANAPTSASYGGVSGIFIGSATTVANGGASGGAWLFINPPTGTQTLTINSGGSEQWVGNYAFYDNFSTAGQPDNTNLLTGNTTATVTRSLTPVTDNCWVVLLSGGADVTPTAGTGTTLRSTGGQSMIGDSNGPIHPASSYSMTATVTSSRTSYVYLVSLAPVSVASGNSNFFALMA